MVNSCGVNKLEATITLEFDDEETAAAVTDAISPDNFTVPAGLFVKTHREKRCVITEVKIEDKASTFVSTIDDLLFSLSVAEKTLRAAKESESAT